jgi:hypothetical protein
MCICVRVGVYFQDRRAREHGKIGTNKPQKEKKKMK